MTNKRTPHSSKRTTKKSKVKKVLMTMGSPVALKPEAMKRMKAARDKFDYKIVKRPIAFRLSEPVQVVLNSYAKENKVARNKVLEAAVVALASGQTVINFEADES